jgi:protein-tyrosine phosphatase
VFVHCVAGVSRSATVVIGYLMWKNGWGYQRAFGAVLDCRSWVSPNKGFRAQLQEFERLGCDLGGWRAWRHTWQEQPRHVSVVAM